MASRMARVIMSSLFAGSGSLQAPAWAGSWNAMGQGQLGASYDDNIRLTPSNHVDAASAMTELSGQLAYQNDSALWSISPRLLAVRYEGEDNYDRTEKYLTMLGRSVTETGSSSITLNGVEDTTLTSELGLTGLTDVNKKHRSGAVTLAAQRNIDERLSMNAQVYAVTNKYVDAAQSGLIDYNYGSALLGAGYQRSERSTLTLQVSAGKLQVPDNDRLDKTNVSLSLGYEFDWSPRWHGSVSAGPSQIRTRNGSQSGSIYAFTLTRATESSHAAISVVRDVTPNGVGSLSRREQVQFAWSKQLAERWTFDWLITAVRNQDVLSSGRLDQASVEYGDTSGSLNFNMTPTWRLSFSAGHSLQRLTDQATANKNRASLSISWNGLMHTLN